MDNVEMTPERWSRTIEWLRATGCPDSGAYAATNARAEAAGLPSIDAGPETARLLRVLARSLRARLIVEVGTLAGATAIDLARALESGGRLITVELNLEHAAFAARELAAAGVAERVEVRVGRGGEVLAALLRDLGDGAADLVFLDADRREYPGMLPVLRRLLRPGGLLAIDNAVSAGRWLPDPPAAGAAPDAMSEAIQAVMADPEFDATVAMVGNGLLIAARR